MKIQNLVLKMVLVTLVVLGSMEFAIAAGDYDLTVIIAADNRPYVEYVAKQWKEKTGGNIEIISVSYNDVHDKIITSVLGGAKVDISTVDVIWPAEFAVGNILAPLDQYITEEMKQKMVPVILDQLIWNGHIYAMPWIHEDKWLYYNTEMLEKGGFSGPPRTLDQMVDMSKQLVDAGLAKYGTAWGWGQHEGLVCDWTVLLHDFGGKWRNEEGEWIFNNEAGQKALDWMVFTLKEGIADPGSITLDDRTVLNLFMQGDTPYVFNWSYAWGVTNDPQESKIAGKVRIGLIPGVPEAGTVSASVTGGGGLGILTTCKKPDVAWEFIELVTNRENQIAALEIVNNPPIWADIYTDEEVLKKYPQFRDMYPQYQYAYIRPVVPYYSEWSQNLQVEIHSALVGQKTVKEALDSAVKFSNDKWKEYGY